MSAIFDPTIIANSGTGIVSRAELDAGSALSTNQLSEVCRLRDKIPVISLGNNQIQVGFPPEHFVVFDNLAKSDLAWFQELRSGQAKISSKQQKQFAKMLQQRGLTEDLQSVFSKLRIVVRGLCAVGIEIALALADSGVKRMELADTRPVDFVVENLFSPECFGVSRQIVTKRILKERHQNLFLGKISKPDLVIVVSSPIPDLSLVGRLMTNDLAHLLVCVSDRAIRIGPLIVPGHTACSVCMEHVLLEENPNWLKLRPKIESLPVPETRAPLRQAAAALTVHMLEQLVNHTTLTTTQPTQAANISVSWKIYNRGVETETWYPHPKCMCTN